MAEIAGTLLAFVLCLGFGRFSEALVLSGIIACVGLLSRRVAIAALFCLVTTLSLALVMSRPGSLVALLPAAVIFICRVALRNTPLVKWGWLVALPVAVLSFRVLDRDIIIASWSAVALLVPTFDLAQRLGWGTSEQGSRRRWQAATAALLLMVPLILLVMRPTTSRNVALLEGGEWAKSGTKLEAGGALDIATMYSYSEFAEVLGATSILVGELDSSYGEAWLITPTRPLSSDLVNLLLSWVRRGGSLIVVTDHTDLFGHARVVNGLLSGTGLETSTTAFFPRWAGVKAQVSMSSDIWLKTSNVQDGWWLWPQVTASWAEEPPDYSARNFFGPTRYSNDDRYGRRTIAGTQAVGRGRITLFGDSTILSNFALYQPGTLPFVERLRHAPLTPLLLLPIYLCLALGVLLSAVLRREYVLLALPIIGVWSIADWGQSPVAWPEFTWWSGDSKAVMEWDAPSKSISTAYALVPLSGKKPRWADDALAVDGGFWVGYNPPPSSKWRWVNLAEATTIFCDYDDRLEPLLLQLNPIPPRCWSETPETDRVSVGRVWTNQALGDWWFDQGISEAKRLRVTAWVNWLCQKKPPVVPEPLKCGEESRRYILRIAEGPAQVLELPLISFAGKKNILLGRGVSAESVEVDGHSALYGRKTLIEGWDAPSSWVLVPESK